MPKSKVRPLGERRTKQLVSATNVVLGKHRHSLQRYCKAPTDVSAICHHYAHHPPSACGRRTLEFLCTSDQLPEAHSRGFERQGQALLAVRRAGEVFVYRNRCPHRRVRLDWQEDQFLDDSASLIRCATHGALFLIESGECVAGPCEGESLQALACRENGNGIWISLPEDD
jgi:nitrite reductase/ring-hydroxylating ferredoxin subunit